MNIANRSRKFNLSTLRLRIDNQSNVLACTTGRLAGFISLEDATNINADSAGRVSQAGAIAHQTANFDSALGNEALMSLGLCTSIERIG
jgi:hypothetical protein